MNRSRLPRLVKLSDQVDPPPCSYTKDCLLLWMPSSPVCEAGGPATLSTCLLEELDCWGGWGGFLPFLVTFFQKRFIGAVCRSEHVEGRGSELNPVKLSNRPPDLAESSPHSQLRLSRRES